MRPFRNFIAVFLTAALFCASALAATSTNKGYDLQTTGSNRGLWGVILNNNLSIIDKNIGGRVVANVAGSANITVSASNAQNIFHRLTGVLTGNIQYILPDNGGVYVIQNATTGAFSVTVNNVLAGTGVVVPQGSTTLVYSNATDNQVEAALTYVTGGLLASNNLSDVSTPATAFTNIKQAATESATGVAELATTSECSTGTDTARICTPAGVAAAIAALTPVVGAVPAGATFHYAGSTPPTGYLEGYGQAVSRTTYSDLFAAIGTVYGTGDGSTTFNLPDCRGRFLAGEDDMGGSAASRLTSAITGGVAGATLGATGGEQGHTLTTSEIPAHTHTQRTISGGGSTNGPLANGGTSLSSASETASTGGGSAHNTVPPVLIMKCIIKY